MFINACVHKYVMEKESGNVQSIGSARPRKQPKEEKTMLEVVRNLAPEIHGIIAGPKTDKLQELDALTARVKERIRKEYNESRLDALPPSSLAMLLLQLYRPNEHARTMVSAPEVIEFIARWAPERTSIHLDDCRGRRIINDEEVVPGSSRAFEYFVKDKQDRIQPVDSFDIYEFSSEFENFFLDAVRRVKESLNWKVWLLEEMAADAAEFMASFLATRPKDAGPRFGIWMETIENSRALSKLQPKGAYAEIGCGEDGLALIEALDRPLILVDKDSLIARMTASFAKRMDKTNVRVICTDVSDLNLEPGSAGLINVRYVLHYLPEDQIPGVITRLISSLTRDGMLRIKEPEYGCCKLESPAKIETIRKALAASSLRVEEEENQYKKRDPFYGKIPAKEIEFRATAP